MKHRTLDEMISYFNQQVSEMDIKHEDKIKLLGMIVAIGYEVQKHKWIPCSERMPNPCESNYWICTDSGYQCQCRWTNDNWGFGATDIWTWKTIDIPQYTKVIAWMPLIEPYGVLEHDE